MMKEGILNRFDGFSIYHNGTILRRTYETIDRWGNRVRVFYNHKLRREVVDAKEEAFQCQKNN